MSLDPGTVTSAGPPDPIAPRGAGDRPGAAAQRSSLGALARGGALNLVGAAVSALTSVALTVVVTRALVKDDAGAFFALTSLFLLGETVARLGTGTGLVWSLSRMRALGQRDRITAVLRVALLPVVGLSVLVASVLAVGAPDFARLVGGATTGAAAAVVVLAVLLPVTTLSDSLLAATRGFASMLPTVVVDRIGRPLLQLVLVAIAVRVDSAALLVAAWAAPWAVSAAVGWWWLSVLRRRGVPSGPAAPADRETWRTFWSFTAPRALASVAQLALQRLDIVLISVLIGPAAAAVYTAATRFLVVGQMANQAISTAVQPRLGELLAVDDRPATNALFRTATTWLVLLTWPLYLLCATFGVQVLRLFGRGYDAGAPVILVLAGAMLVATGCGMVDMVLNMAGRTSWNLANAFLALAVNIAVDLVLIPRIGIMGAAIGWAAAIVVNNVLPLAQLTVHLQLHPFDRGTRIAMVLSAVCFGVLPLIAYLSSGGRPLVVAGVVALGAVLWLVGCLHWRDALSLAALRSLGRGRRPGSGRHAGRPTTPGQLPDHPARTTPAAPLPHADRCPTGSADHPTRRNR
ncbi:MAG: multi antimicrobial extrusion protein MatE [Modestobacter sp.]|nr:multi antimicrobial extrusion protein MatE [Modestobacter sp.]